jgi:sugar (pentulose or hexulose) kinase
VPEAIVGLDVGTTVAKAVLFDISGVELCVAAQAYRLQTPQPGRAELEPDDIWQAVVRVLRDVVSAAPPGIRIRAIALATQGGTLVPCRADGRPTYRAITWMDGRSKDLVARWRAESVADRVRRVCGWSPQPGLPLPSIGWLRQDRPGVFAATERFLSVNDFLAQRLTGRAATNPSMAGEMLLTDVSTGEWSEELCSLVGIEPGRLSPILPSTAPLGQIQPEVSRLTGLAPEMVVVNGGQDHSCEALALGMTATGAGLLACGTAWVINGIAESPSVDAIPASMDLNYHVVPGRWVASQFLGGLGACLEWWLNQCSGLGTQTGVHAGAQVGAQQCCAPTKWAAFNAALEGTTPGCGGLLYLPQPGARQAQGALRHGGFLGLRLDHSWADMGRAMLEGAAYELRWALEHLRRAGLAMEQMWMVGGAAQSPIWPQIVADVSGLPVLLSQYSHGPALGAAILAGAGLGIFDSVAAAQAHFQVSARRIEPEGAHAPVYDRQFAAYQRLAGVLAQ